ncbi:hypothetical protein CDD83_6965 [Cordyceps sp. RAO-2017]|nr:hypothetical protein CDD83_6965 [Cordyceps sp. RAO-2017]
MPDEAPSPPRQGGTVPRWRQADRPPESTETGARAEATGQLSLGVVAPRRVRCQAPLPGPAKGPDQRESAWTMTPDGDSPATATGTKADTLFLAVSIRSRPSTAAALAPTPRFTMQQTAAARPTAPPPSLSLSVGVDPAVSPAPVDGPSFSPAAELAAARDTRLLHEAQPEGKPNAHFASANPVRRSRGRIGPIGGAA